MKTILLVDDQESILDILGALLRDEGYFVRTAKSGLEGLDRCGGVDVVVSDINLGSGMNGLEMLKEVRETDPGIARVVVSGTYPFCDELYDTYFAAEPDAYFEKPPEFDSFFETIRKLAHR